MEAKVYFNPWDEAFRANPYPHYRGLSGQPPYLLDLFVPAALIGRYRDALTILHQLLRQRRLLLVFDDFEQNLTVGGDTFRDPGFADVFTGLSAAVLHRSVDAAVLVCHRGLTGERAILRAREVLESGGVPLLGLAETFV